MTQTTANKAECLSEAALERLATDQCDPTELTRSEEHVSTCAECRELLESRSIDSCWQTELLPAFQTDDADDDLLSTGEPESLETIYQAALKLLGPTDDPHMLGRIASYEVVGVIGSGAMGVVFKAFDAALNRFVAIKMMQPHLAVSGAARQRFARESRAAAAVIDDCVLPIHAVSQWQGVPYLVMQYSAGMNLQKRLEVEGPLKLSEILRISMQTARGLVAAHGQGLVHRDVKPSNILLDGSVERALLTDFGLARAVDDASVTRTGLIAGTPQYMSPEQVRGESVDARSDLFSLGATMYAMCTGRSPFRGESTYSVLHRLTHNEPRSIQEINPEIPAWLCGIIGKLLSKTPDERFQSADEVAELLEDCLAHVQSPATTSLPAGVQASACSTPANNSLKAGLQRIPPFRKLFAAVAFAFFAIAGVLIFLETNKGIIRIESNSDVDIPITIRQGDHVVQHLTVSQQGSTSRLKVGQYVIEVEGDDTRFTIKGDEVELSRGETWIATINEVQPASPYLTPEHELTVRRMERILAALHQYHELHQHIPPSVIRGKDGSGGPPHSWRVEILPQLGEQELYDQYHFDEPWDSEHNKSLLSMMPDVFRSPRDASGSVNAAYFGVTSLDVQKPPRTSEIALTGSDSESLEDIIVMGDPSTFFEATDESTTGEVANDEVRDSTETDEPQGTTVFWNEGGASFKNMCDGTSNTIAIVEAKREIPWTQPVDIEYSVEKPLPKFGGWFAKGWHAGFAHGSVKYLSHDSDERTVRNLLTIADGQPVAPSPALVPNSASSAVQSLGPRTLTLEDAFKEQLGGEAGSFVTVPLRVDWHPEVEMKRMLGREHLTVLGDGTVVDDSPAKAIRPIQYAVLHGCRLASYGKTTRDGTEYWTARLFVPLKPVYSIGSLWFKDPVRTMRLGDRHTPVPSPSLTQDDPQAKIDEVLADHHSLRLEGSRDNLQTSIGQVGPDDPEKVSDTFSSFDTFSSLSGTHGILTVLKAASIDDAVASFNRLAIDSEIGKSQPELTTDEVIAAFRNWIDRKECSAKTRETLRQVIDTRLLQPGSQLGFNTRYVSEGHVFDVWEIKFGDASSYPWFKVRETVLLSRLKSEQEKKLWEQAKEAMAESFRHFKLGASDYRSQEEQQKLGKLLDQVYQSSASTPSEEHPKLFLNDSTSDVADLDWKLPAEFTPTTILNQVTDIIDDIQHSDQE